MHGKRRFFDLSAPAGEGYVVFTEGYSSNGITFWYEEAGDEWWFCN